MSRATSQEEEVLCPPFSLPPSLRAELGKLNTQFSPYLRLAQWPEHGQFLHKKPLTHPSSVFALDSVGASGGARLLSPTHKFTQAKSNQNIFQIEGLD